VLKGPSVAAFLYPETGLRHYLDLDIAVPEDSQSEVDALVCSMGFELEEDHGGFDAAHRKLHESPYEHLYVQPGTRLKLDIHFDHLQLGLAPRDAAGFWNRCQPWSFKGAPALAPGINDLFLLLAVHLHRHSFARLSCLKDIDLFVRKFGDEIDWAWLKRSASEEGASTSLSYSLYLASRLLETPLPPAAARLAQLKGMALLNRIVWREQDLFTESARKNRLRRAIQYVPWDGPRGALPSLVFMGRRREKMRALWHRLLPTSLR
jgi:hypothetical protein